MTDQERGAHLRVDIEAGLVFGVFGKPFRRLSDAGYIKGRAKGQDFLAHRFLWERANGPIPEGMQINHINGIKTDNSAANL